MWAARYWAKRYWAGRYWPPTGKAPPPVVTVSQDIIYTNRRPGIHKAYKIVRIGG